MPQGRLAEGPEVPLTRLDNLLGGERTPDLIKIDVQGGECAVLRSADRLLQRPERKPAIILEYAPLALSRSGELQEVWKFAADHGYQMRAFIANPNAKTLPPQIRWATLQAIADDFVAAECPAEFDLLLLPRS